LIQGTAACPSTERTRDHSIYPGSFDPLTFGHIDILQRSVRLFDRVRDCDSHQFSKSPLFPVTERLEIVREIVSADFECGK